jgi:hypothetical protein
VFVLAPVLVLVSVLVFALVVLWVQGQVVLLPNILHFDPQIKELIVIVSHLQVDGLLAMWSY